MPRKQKADIGAVPCPKCRALVPLRKDAKGNFYEVCAACNKDRNGYYLDNGYIFSPGESMDSVKEIPGLSNPSGIPPAPGSESVPVEIESIVVPARPVPEKVRAAVQGRAGDIPKPEPEQIPEQVADDSADMLGAPAEVLEEKPVSGKKSLLAHIAGGGDKAFNDWFNETDSEGAI